MVRQQEKNKTVKILKISIFLNRGFRKNEMLNIKITEMRWSWQILDEKNKSNNYIQVNMLNLKMIPWDSALIYWMLVLHSEEKS